MAKFTYTAHDVNGREKSGTVTAADQAAAISRLRSKGLFPVDVRGTDLKIPKEATAKKKPAGLLQMELRLPAALSVVRPKQMMVMTRQMATLIRAGLPLLRGLKVLQRQQNNAALKKTLGAVADAIEGGSTFADALAEHPKHFNRLYVNMVKAGEAGGLLDIVLERLADYMEKAQKVRNRIKGAMTYPIVVLLASGGIMIFLMTAIIPRFEKIFADMLQGQALPPLTLYVMGVSERIRHGWPWALAVLALLFGLAALLRRFRHGRLAVDAVRLLLPIFGPLSRMALLARFSRTLGTLLEAGVPILQALTIVKNTLENEVARDAVDAIHDAVKEGEAMVVPVEAHRLFPPILSGMVEVGEETGQLPTLLLKAADLYEDEVDNAVAALSSIIEPVLIIILALVVGTIVIAMFLPMVSIIGNLS